MAVGGGGGEGRAGEAYTGACIEPGFPWDRGPRRMGMGEIAKVTGKARADIPCKLTRCAAPAEANSPEAAWVETKMLLCHLDRGGEGTGRKKRNVPYPN